MNANLLDVRNLSVSFHTDDGVFQAVDNVSLHVKSGEIVGLVGESGCGKSVTALSILRLIPSPPGKIECGSDPILRAMIYSNWTLTNCAKSGENPSV